eukprot:m.185654 g.185654  ORF g.185654 m.185654 type:complete len:591 (+) comp15579_c0_seq2:183-1955(+)
MLSLKIVTIILLSALQPSTPMDIVPGLPWPQGLQGHDDENYPMSLLSNSFPTSDLLQRYKVITSMKPGIRRYNMFWSAMEQIHSSSTSNISCPEGTIKTPANEEDKDKRGYRKYHCYNKAELLNFDAVFALDAAAGAQNAAILYSAPPFYRHPNCTGFSFGKVKDKDGCVPMPQYLDDYYDYVNMLAERWATNNLKHFIVWNEVASAGWMDLSPDIPNRAGPNGSNPLTDAQTDYLVSRYAELMNLTAQAVSRHTDIAMIWSSNDRLWERPHQREGDPLHIGVRPLLDRLWPKIKTSFTWAMAVHPYDPGNPADVSEFMPGFHPQAYTFGSLSNVVDYQRKQVQAVGGLDPDSVEGKPFTLLYASEQGWPSPACCNDRIRARNICYAHSLAKLLPEMVAVTHNFFQDSPDGSSQGGQDYGLIAGNITATLSNGTGYPTFDAYVSTSSPAFGTSNDHYCCETWSVGCSGIKRIHGDFDPTSSVGRDITLHGWAWDEGTMGAGRAPVDVRIVVNGDIVMNNVTSNVSRPDLVAAGVSPTPDHGFNVTISSTANMLNISVFVVNSPSSNVPVQLEESPRCLKWNQGSYSPILC